MGILQSKKYAYGLFYIAFFSFQAYVMAFFPLYIKSIGFSAFQIALTMTSEDIANLIGSIWGTRIVGRFRYPATFIIGAMCFSLLVFLPLIAFNSFILVIGFWFLCLVGTKISHAVINADAVREAGAGVLNYGQVRLWGSISFVVAVFAIGGLIDEFKIDKIAYLGGAILAVIVFILWLIRNAIYLPNTNGQNKGLLCLLRQQRFSHPLVILIATMCLSWSAHAILYTYISVYLQQLGWSGKLISLSWVVGVVAEVLVFIFFDRIHKHLRLLTIIKCSIIIAIFRWLILANCTSVGFIIFAQILHGITFGSFFIATLKLGNLYVAENYKIEAQGLMAGLGSGIGVLSGRVIGGISSNFIPVGSTLAALFFISALLSTFSYIVSCKLTCETEVETYTENEVLNFSEPV